MRQFTRDMVYPRHCIQAGHIVASARGVVAAGPIKAFLRLPLEEIKSQWKEARHSRRAHLTVSGLS